ncbi:MAG TPA: recombination mediator RecR [Gammaproteobacteria bacterium]|nr:recombination mediator RecR [Gammaproteobacteria bacterium]
MSESNSLDKLIHALCCMPGIGKKSAQRIAYHLLQRDRDGARRLAEALENAADTIGHCRRCRTFSETDICSFCASSKRDESLICVVENPADVYAIEEADYRGHYFVLMGHLSPLDGIGPDELGLDKLAALLDEGNIKEVILATNTTVEGEATAHFISEMVRKRKLRVTRIAHGIPMGGELGYVTSSTISRAIEGRREI